jgi:hypothetical protein
VDSLAPINLGHYEGMDLGQARPAINDLFRNHPDEKPGVSPHSGQPGESFNEAAKRIVDGVRRQAASLRPGQAALNITSGRVLEIVDAMRPDGSVDVSKVTGGQSEFSKPGQIYHQTPNGLVPVDRPQPGQNWATHGETEWNQGATEPTPESVGKQMVPGVRRQAMVEQNTGVTPPQPTRKQLSEQLGVPKPAEQGEPGWVGNVPTSSIRVDAPRFQFKRNVGQGGAGEELREVRTWDPEKAGIISVWKDPKDGQTYVVNGHHRIELAQRTGAAEVTVRYIDAPTAQKARLKGALINVAEGRGESTDAAKIFREGQMSAADLEREGVSLKGKVASEGLAISKLAQPLYDGVMSGDISTARGAILGQLENPQQQLAVYDLLKQRERAGKRLTNDQVAELIRLQAPERQETQEGLFGAEEMTRSLLPEKAEVSEYVRKQLGSERKLFSAVGTQAAAEKLGETGNVIRAEENANRAQGASQAQLLYDKYSTVSGSVSTALDRAAERLANGEDANAVKRDAYREIRQFLRTESDRLTGVPQGNDRGVEGRLQSGGGEAGGGEQNPGVVSPTLSARLESQAQAALDRIRQRGTFTGQKLNAGLPLDDLADLALWGAAKLAKSTVDFAGWSRDALAEFGERVRPYLARIYQAAHAQLEDQSPAARNAPSGTGPFGPIFQGYTGKPLDAIARLQREQTGEMPRVWYNPELARATNTDGWIGLAWGDLRGGLAHIIDKHVNRQHDLKLEDLAEIVPDMRVVGNNGRTVEMESESHHASVRLSYDDTEKRWLVTAFERRPPTGESPVGPGSPSGRSGDPNAPPSGPSSSVVPRASGVNKGPQEGLFSSEAERQSQLDAQHNADKLLGDRLTAQFQSGLAAKPTKLKPAKNRGLFEEEQPESGDLFGPERGGVRLSMLGLGIPEFIEQDVKPRLESAAVGVVRFADDILKVLAPTLRGGPKVEEGKLAFRGRLGEMARRSDQARHALRQAERYFDAQPKEANYEFWDRIEAGQKQDTPALDAIAAALRKLLDGRRQDVQDLGTGKLRNFHENYMPRAWKDPKSALQWIRDFYARRPFEGGKSFLKQRTYPTMKEGRDAGLQPITDNPVTMTLLKIQEMDRYIAAHRTLNDWKATHDAIFVDARDGKALQSMTRMGWKKIDDPIGAVYGPSVQPITEYPNEGIWKGLQAVANALGLKQERGFLNLRGAIGRAQQGTGRVQTLHGTAEDVLAHEIGHQIDFLAGSGKRFVLEYPDAQTVARLKRAYATLKDTEGTTLEQRRAARDELKSLKSAIAQRKEFQRQLRALADLRSGEKAYTHKREEKMAQLAEMWVGSRELFERTAPTVFAEWKKFLDENPRLHALRDIEGNTEVSPIAQPYDVGGLVIKGNWWAPEGLTRLLNNHLMPGLSDKALFKGIMGLNNHLNLFNLGFSAFHVGKTSLEASISRLALSYEAMLRGHPLEAAKFAVTTPVVPFTAFLKGDKMLKEWYEPGSQGAEIGELADRATEAGARARMDQIYRTRIAAEMEKALHTWNLPGAALRVPSAAAETLTNVIMDQVVPRLKMGVFADMARFHLDAMGKGAKPIDVTRQMANDWNSVENRLGEVTRDNLFWNRYARDLATMLMRADQWTLGTIREIGGAAGDIAAQPARALKGEPVNLNRLTYVAAMVTLHMAYSALYQYAHTGQGPQELEDYFFPKNGQTDEQGRAQRSVIPSYVKDVYGIARHPITTFENKEAAGLALASQLIRNRDFYNVEIRHPDDAWFKQLEDTGLYVAKGFTPFAVRNFLRERGLGAPGGLSAEQFIGVSPAPADLDRSPAERLATELGAEGSEGSRTKEAFERTQAEHNIRRLAGMRKPVADEIRKNLQSGTVDIAGVKRALNEARMDPLMREFRSLSLDKALRVYKVAKPEERGKLRPLLIRKAKTLAEKSPAERAVLLPQLREALQ